MRVLSLMKRRKMMKKSNQHALNDADIQFLESIRSGDINAFNELVQKYEGRLYNFGLKVCKDVSDAEDLVQETFINVFKSTSRTSIA